MTTYVQARDALVGHIDAAFKTDKPAVKLFYENTLKVDPNNVGDSFVSVAIDMVGAKQASIEFNPRKRMLGEVTFRFMFKEGKGTREALGLYDYVDSMLGNKNIDGVQTRTAVPGRKRSGDGWVSFDFYVPFIFDSID